MPPTPTKPGKTSGKPAAKKVNGGKLLDSVLAEVRKLYKGRTVEFRPGALNGKGEKLIRLDGDTIAYVSILENGNIRALRSKYGLKVTDADPKKVARGIQAAVKGGVQTTSRGKASSATPARGKAGAGKSGASGTTRQRQAASRRAASEKKATTPPRVTQTAGSTPTTEPKANGPRKNNNGPKTNDAPAGK